MVGAAGSLLTEGLNFGAGAANRRFQRDMIREQNAFNSREAEVQRNWQEKVSDPAFLRSRFENAGFNPTLALNGQSASVGSGSAASAGSFTPAPAPHLDTSSIGSTMASVAEAIRISKEASYVDENQVANLDFLRAQGDKLRGDTNWLNRVNKDWRPSLADQDLSRAFIRKQMTGEMERVDLANSLLGQQKVLFGLDAEAKRLSNYYYPQQVQQDLALKAQRISDLVSQIDFRKLQGETEKQRVRLVVSQIAKEYAAMDNLVADTQGKRISNDIADRLKWSYISASEASNRFDVVRSNLDAKTYAEFREATIQELKSTLHLNDARAEQIWNSIFVGRGTDRPGFDHLDRFTGRRSPGPIVRRF